MVISLDRWIGKVAIVTGASSGIGADLAEKLVQAGLNVVGLARRKERLKALEEKLAGSKGNFYGRPTDVSKEEEIKTAFKWTSENVGPICILANVAAIGGEGYDFPVIGGNYEGWKAMLNTNVLALATATREAIQSMTENKIDGHIITISSIQGHKVLAIPNLSMYTASKHAVNALAEAIRLELVNAKSKIKITNVSPGLVLTDMVPKEDPFIQDLIKEEIYLNTEDVSDGIIYALSTPPHVQVHQLTIKPVGEPM